VSTREFLERSQRVMSCYLQTVGITFPEGAGRPVIQITRPARPGRLTAICARAEVQVLASPCSTTPPHITRTHLQAAFDSGSTAKPATSSGVD